METIDTLLRDLAAQLGTTVEYLWEVLVKQAYVHYTLSLIGSVVFFLCLVGSIVVLILLFKKIKGIKHGSLVKRSVEYFGEDAYLTKTILNTCCAILGFIASSILLFHNIYQVITCKINPEYWALQEILSTLGS